MRIALFQPEIAGNVGAVMRLGACLDTPVDLIEPMGFAWDDKRVARAAMDYIDHVRVTRHPDWDAFAAGVQGRIVLLPLINQMNPSADVLAQSTTEVDLSAIQPGQAIKTIWRKQPLFVRNLTPKEIAEANAVDASSLRDPQSLADRTKEGKQNWLITLGVCTHLGCVPLGAGEGENKGPFGGYFCPCHGSAYDTAGRIRSGPAPLNLHVPDYAFTSDTVVTVG